MKKKKIKLLSRGGPVVAMGGGGECSSSVRKAVTCSNPDVRYKSYGRSGDSGDDIGPIKPF